MSPTPSAQIVEWDESTTPGNNPRPRTRIDKSVDHPYTPHHMNSRTRVHTFKIRMKNTNELTIKRNTA